jgi:predicted RNA-binding protein YlqC (UPF0109 family)
MFAGKGASADQQKSVEPLSSDSPVISLDNAVSFVDYVVKSLVDSPADVKIVLKKGVKENVINIHCRKDDIGKIIGKNGKTIMAIRTLVSGAASRINSQLNVEVVDQVAD